MKCDQVPGAAHGVGGLGVGGIGIVQNGRTREGGNVDSGPKQEKKKPLSDGPEVRESFHEPGETPGRRLRGRLHRRGVLPAEGCWGNDEGRPAGL